MKTDLKSAIEGLRRYPALCSAALFVVLSSTWAFFRSDAVAEKQSELDKYVVEGERYRSNITNGAQLQQQIDFLVDANQRIEKRAFKSGSLALHLQYFYRLEAEIGIKLQASARPAAAKTPNTAGTYLPIGYTVGVTGTFPQVIAFMRTLEQGAYFSRINSALITGKGQDATLSLDIDILGIP